MTEITGVGDVRFRLPATPQHQSGAPARSRKRRLRYVTVRLFCLCGLLWPAGCADETLGFTEVKRIHEKVTDAELEKFLKIVSALPDNRLPTFPPVFAPVPDWNQTRTLSVSELMREERGLLDERWNEEWLSRHLKRERRLQRVIRRERMTLEQFVGMTLTVGTAMSRNTLRANQDLSAIMLKGESNVEKFLKDERNFSTLSQEQMYAILQRAAWLTRIDRAHRLQLVPPENISLVRKHWEALEKVFPIEFTTNPLDAIADRLEEQGLPFEELADSGSDIQIEWDRADSIVGYEAPDPEFSTQASDVP